MKNKSKNLSMFQYMCYLSAVIWILCGLVVLLSSCTDTTDPSTNPYKGPQIAVKFKFAGVNKPGREVITNSRSASTISPDGQFSPIEEVREEPDIPCVIPVADDLLMYATLEVDQEVNLRADTIPLASGTMLRIVAYENGTVYHAHADYTIDKNGELDNRLLKVAPGNYKFVAYSYNTTALPPHNNETLSNIDPAIDLLWGCYPTSGTYPVTSDAYKEVPITLSHLFSQVKIQATTADIPGSFNITRIDSVRALPDNSVNLAIKSGGLTKGNSIMQRFTWPSLGATTVSSAPRTVCTHGANPTSFKIGSITLDGTRTFTDRVALFNKSLQGGVSYTLRVSFKREDPTTITVFPTDIFLLYTAQYPAFQPIQVNCTKHDGTPDLTKSWTLSVSAAAASWLRLSLSASANFNSASTTVTGTGNQAVYIYVTANSTQNLRLSELYLNGVSVGNIAQEWDSYTNPGLSTTPNATSYVGAFWRKTQKGERLIQTDMGTDVSNYGDWKAVVMWMDGNWKLDDIVLALGDSPNLLLDAENPVNAVTGNAKVVKGTVSASEKIISFRIGLKSTYTPTANYPARYAVVILFYNNYKKAQKIFLRQGEDADYIMRPQDRFEGSAALPPRSYAVKFSPYNLTASNIPGGVNSSGHPQLAVKGGVFVDYPTKAGAFFTWAGGPTNVRRAYHPVNPTEPISNWPGLNLVDCGEQLWQRSYEACPSGYRRPSDSYSASNNSGNAWGSEMRESLFTNRVTGFGTTETANNVLHGYYADGYFDRNPKETSVTGEANSAVNKTSQEVAYRGHLLYNPITNASIFFPAAGYRDGSDANAKGRLKSTGNTAYYWTITDTNAIVGTMIASCLYLWSNGMSMQSKRCTNGYSIRCVKE